MQTDLSQLGCLYFIQKSIIFFIEEEKKCLNNFSYVLSKLIDFENFLEIDLCHQPLVCKLICLNLDAYILFKRALSFLLKRKKNVLQIFPMYCKHIN